MDEEELLKSRGLTATVAGGLSSTFYPSRLGKRCRMDCGRWKSK
jgi:hypothetical protein